MMAFCELGGNGNDGLVVFGGVVCVVDEIDELTVVLKTYQTFFKLFSTLSRIAGRSAYKFSPGHSVGPTSLCHTTV